MSVHVYILCYNEAFMLPHVIQYYKQRFQTCEIFVCDNESTDASVEIAVEHGCKVIRWNTQDTLNDFALVSVKNELWKQCSRDADWCIVVDADEFIEVSEEILRNARESGVTIFRTTTFNIVSQEDTFEIDKLHHGVPWPPHGDKTVVFSPKDIECTNFTLGTHSSNPTGNVRFAEQPLFMWHMKFWNLQWMIDRYNLCASRLPKEFVERGIAIHYVQIEKLREDFSNARSNALDLRPILRRDYVLV